MSFKKRGQAALEFLMTYGWAILVVLVVVGALAYFGIMNPDTILASKCTLQTGFNCKDYKVDPDSRMFFMDVTNTMGKGIMINQVNISGKVLGENGCSLNPDTKLPPKYENPLDGSFNGNPGLRLREGQTETLPIRCYDQIDGGNNKAKMDIKIEWHLEYSSPQYNHVSEGELYDRVKKGACGKNEVYVDGLDGSNACCGNFDDYVIDWECISCPDDKPYLAYITSFSGESNTEIGFETGEPPYENNSHNFLIPCQADVMKAEFDIINERSLTNESEFFSTVILTDVSGSMMWQFDRWAMGTDRICTSDLLFDTTTMRMSLARCIQTGISNSEVEFDGIISKLLDEFEGNRLGLVTFQSVSSIKSYLSNDINSLKSIVSGYAAGGGTNIEQGLRSSVEVLETSNPNDINYIILISDGEESFGSDVESYVCGAEFPEDTAVYALGMGPAYFFEEGYEGDCDYAGTPSACRTLQNVASCSNGKAYSAMTPEGAITAVEEIIGIILHYPSNLEVMGEEYEGLLKGTYAEPDYLEPKPNITTIVQDFSDACIGTDNMIFAISSESQGYVRVSDIDIRACYAEEYP